MGQPCAVVVGASGILAPLGGLLRQAGLRTCGVSRGSRLDAGEWDLRLAVDAHDPGAVSEARRAHETPDLVVAYAPAVADAVWPVLSEGVGRVVAVATTSAAAPGAAAPPWGRWATRVLQLGWADAEGGPRWHTAEEVSAAVLLAVTSDAEGQTHVLGRVRPWSERPA